MLKIANSRVAKEVSSNQIDVPQKVREQCFLLAILKKTVILLRGVEYRKVPTTVRNEKSSLLYKKYYIRTRMLKIAMSKKSRKRGLIQNK